MLFDFRGAIDVIEEELDLIKRNETWEMVTSPPRRERSSTNFVGLDYFYETTKQVSIDLESCYLTQVEPSSYHEASNKSVWRHTIEEDLDSIERNKHRRC